MFTAEEALSAGLATEIVAREDLDERVSELCAALESHAPITMRVTKEAIRRLTLAEMPDATRPRPRDLRQPRLPRGRRLLYRETPPRLARTVVAGERLYFL